MDNRRVVLSLLFLTVVASGCSHTGPGGSEGDASVTVNRLDVRPSTINSGGEVNIWAEAENTGRLTGDVAVGGSGSKVLRDYCSDIFKLNSFTATSSVTDETREKYTLDPGQSLNMRWRLKQQGDVPIYGIPCDMRLELPFNYSVNAYRQVQIKQDREVEGSPELPSESTTGPLRIAVETLPSVTGKHYTFVPEDENITVQIQFLNKNPSGEYRKGLIDIDENSLEIKASEPLELDEESNEKITGEASTSPTAGSDSSDDSEGSGTDGSGSEMSWGVNADYEDPRCDVPEDIRMNQGRSIVVRCEVPIPDDLTSPSRIAEVSVSANYTYIKNLGEKTVRVEKAAN